MMTRFKPAVSWPAGTSSALSMTFDIDAETMWTSRDPLTKNRPAVLSQGQYDVGEGLANVLDFLDKNEISSTFFVPSQTALRHPDEISEIARRGHEIGCHGTDHVPLENANRQQEFDHIKQATEQIEDAIGVKPAGYRAPMYGISQDVWSVLNELGYKYSSNMSDSVRPYLTSEGVVEIPVSWTLDDGPFFLVSYFPPNFRVPAQPSKVKEIWLGEAEGISSQGGITTLILHPQLIGRPSRLSILQDVVDASKHRGNVWFPKLEEVADLLLE